MKILDTGTRREFATGAVRDSNEGRGRCDLLPLDVIAHITDDDILPWLNIYVTEGKIFALKEAVRIFVRNYMGCLETALLEVSKHFEDGAKKYDERNWQKGIPLHCYIDSAVRHYLKYRRGDRDEPHDRAFLWNILCAIWTHLNKPEMIDLPFADKEKNKCE